MHCPNCGLQNQPGARFCQSCGAQLLIYPAPQPQRRNPWLLWFGILAIIVCLLAVAGFGLFYIFGPEDITISLFDQPAAPVDSGQQPVQPPVIQQSPVEQPAQQQPLPESASAQSTDTPIPTATFTQTTTPTVTSTGTPPYPVFTAGQNSLCRAGPSTSYEVITSINAGDTVRIHGKSAPPWEEWWYVDVNGVKCWVWSGLGTAGGNLGGVVVVAAPATPTFTPTEEKFYAFTFKNNSGRDICNLYMRYEGTLNWGPDLLFGRDGTWIDDGKSKTYYFPPGTWDFRLVGCTTLGGYDRVFQAIKIPDKSSLVLPP